MHIFYVIELTFTVSTTTTTHSDYIPNSTYLSWSDGINSMFARSNSGTESKEANIVSEARAINEQLALEETRVRISNQTQSKQIV